MFYEADGVRIRVTITGGVPDDPVPADLLFAEVHARKLGAQPVRVSGVAYAAGAVVVIEFPPRALSAGVWRVQLRAGADASAARTVFEAEYSVRESLALA